jgi:mannosyl-oligosaccharide alpha-1,2-mannosidase
LQMLYAAFDTPNRMPVLRWRKLGVEVPLGQSLLAELGSMSLEFTRLSVLTGDGKFYDAVQRITNHFETHQNQTRIPGLWPSVINAREGGMGQGTTFSLAGASDSMYEYLVKVRHMFHNYGS